MLLPHTFRTLALLVLVAGVAVGCQGDQPSTDEAAGPPTATISPTPTPSPTPEPVVPTVAVETVVVSSAPNLFDRAPEREVDTEVVDRFVARVTAWLDTHVRDLGGGGSGTLEAVATDGLLDNADPDVIAAVTTSLVPADGALTAVAYDIQVAADGPPEWLSVRVETTLVDGSVRAAEFVFVPSDQGPQLVAAGPGGVA